MSKELDETVLNLQQRMKRAQTIRRNEKKLERSREIAKAKLAPDKNIQKRAYSQARQIVRRKVAGQRGAEYETLGPTEKMAIDRLVERRQKLIKKIALRLMPKVKQAEQARLQAFMKGKALKNEGQPEGNTKMNEELNEKFASTFNKPKELKVDPKGKKRSPIVQYSKFDEEVESESVVYRAIAKKSMKSGISEEVLGIVYDRGMESWVEETGVSQQQYAFARVNSFINKGRTYFNEDADLHEMKVYSAPKGTLSPFKEKAIVAQHNLSKKRYTFDTEDEAKQHFGKNWEKMQNHPDWTVRAGVKEGFKNWTFEMQPGDRTKVIHGDRKGLRGVVVKKHDNGASYSIKDKDGNISRHHISTLTEPMTEAAVVADGEPITPPPSSPGSKVRKKLEMVDRKTPNGELTKQTEYMRKVIESSEIDDAFKNHFEEDVKVADKAPVVVPAHNDAHGNLIPAMTVMRKKQKRIIHSGNVHDGEGN